MPAPRAVICDIEDRGLDPTRPHGRISSDGRLAGPAASIDDPKPVPEDVQRHPQPYAVPHREDEKKVPKTVEEEPEEVTNRNEPTDDSPELEPETPVAKKGRNKKSTETPA